MNANELVKNIKGDFISTVVRPFIISCGAIYVVHDDEFPAISLLKAAKRRAIYSSTELLTKNSMDFVVSNTIGRPNSFSARLSLRVGIAVCSKSLASSFWPERRTRYYIIYRPLRCGVVAGLKYIFKYYREADAFFQANMPRARNHVVNYLQGGVIHAVYLQTNIYYERVHNFIMNAGLTDENLAQIAEFARICIPGNWGDYVAELFSVDHDHQD